MGVPGFITFLRNNKESLFRSRRLENTYLVIDGKNVTHYLFKKTPFNGMKFGGDYDKFYKLLTNFFLDLKTCNVTPIVVSDGIGDNKKEDKKFRRWLGKLKSLRMFKNGRTPHISLPLNEDVFKTVLVDLGIHHFTALYEADRDSAIIANLLNCPVLSGDSDFCFYKVEFMFTEMLDLQLKKNESTKSYFKYYMESFIFDRETFIERHLIGEELFFIIPVVLGYDNLQTTVSYKFYKSVSETKANACDKLTILLEWMKKQATFQSIVRCISNFSEDMSEIDVLNTVNEVKIYYTLDNDLNIPYIIINKDEDKVVVNKNIKSYMIPREHPLSKHSEHVIRSFIASDIYPSLISSNYKSVINTHCLYEDIDEVSSAIIILPLFCAQLQIFDRISGFGSSLVRLIRVRNAHYNFREIKLYFSENFLSNVTNEIFTAEVEFKEAFFREIIGFTGEKKFDWDAIGIDWQLFLFAVAYWMKNKKNCMSEKSWGKVYPESFIMTALANNAENRMNLKITNRLKKIPETEISSFAESMKAFRLEKPEVSYCLSTIHEFSLLQICLQEFQSLNASLNYPFPAIKIQNFFSSTIAYNLNHELRNPTFSEVIMELTPNVLNFFNLIMKRVEELTDCLTKLI